MNLRKLYDETNPKSIADHAIGLVNKSFEEVLFDYFGDAKEYNIKRKRIEELGMKADLEKLLEKFYFGFTSKGYKEVTFSKAEVELKVLPCEEMSSEEYIVNENMIVGSIPEDVYSSESHFKKYVLEKLKIILLVLFQGNKNQPYIRHKICYSKLLPLSSLILEKDGDIIRSDFNLIVEKYKQNKLQEITESTTTCLSVSSTWAISPKDDLSDNSNTNKLRKVWMFTLKKDYVSKLINNHFREDIIPYKSLLSERVTVKEFDEIIKAKIMTFKGYSEKELQKYFEMTNTSTKNIRHMLTLEMLGIKSMMIEEFKVTRTIIKTIRINKKGRVKESMSFPAIKFKDFVLEEWEKSAIYKYFTENRFLFIIYKSKGDTYVLENVKFWHMPIEDLQKIGFSEWKAVQNIIKEGVKLTPYNGRVLNNLPKKSETKMFHLRPHANKSAYMINGVKYGTGELALDCDDLPNGDKMTKQSFWLNNNYIEEQINKR